MRSKLINPLISLLCQNKSTNDFFLNFNILSTRLKLVNENRFYNKIHK